MVQTYILKNGLRLIHHDIPSKTAYCGLLINVGSRDEQPDELGVAHFIEHVIFKGTVKRKAYHILSRLEDVGGELNAYTTKEDTCIYATFMPKDYERALELFADIVFHSVFPEKELEKEKDVVLDEINSYRDTPSELIFDEFEEMIYQGYPIGRNILGDEASVQRIDRELIRGFIHRNYHPNQMVISSVGDIAFEKLISLVERFFSIYPSGEKPLPRVKPALYCPRTLAVDKDTYQSHCIIGNIAYDYTQENRLALSLLVNLLGGAGMNSRLNLHIRERYGLAYNIEASYTPYSDTGTCMIYYGCEKGSTSWCMELCKREMRLLYEVPLGPLQLKRAKSQMIGQLTIASENYENLMLSNGKSFLIFDRVDSLEEVYEQIGRITPEMLMAVAREVFDVEKQSVLFYK